MRGAVRRPRASALRAAGAHMPLARRLRQFVPGRRRDRGRACGRVCAVQSRWCRAARERREGEGGCRLSARDPSLPFPALLPAVKRPLRNKHRCPPFRKPPLPGLARPRGRPQCYACLLICARICTVLRVVSRIPLVCAGRQGEKLDASSEEASHAESRAEERESWAEQSEMSLYHSAQGSFGHSSTASSMFASVVQMDRSIAQRVQQETLAEEDEDGSDADSFFSASDDGHREDDDCRCSAVKRTRLEASCTPAHDCMRLARRKHACTQARKLPMTRACTRHLRTSAHLGIHASTDLPTHVLIALCESKAADVARALHSCSAPFASDFPGAPAARDEMGEALGASDCGGCGESCRVTVKQEIVSKAACASSVAHALPGLNEASTASMQDRAQAQRQREQEEWEVAMRVIAEEKMEESRQEELRLSLLKHSDSGVRLEDADASLQSASATPALAEDTAAMHPWPAIGHAPAAAAAGVCSVADLGDRLDACALERMSKKELVAHIQAMAAPDVLQAYGLSGSPSNVAKKTAKEKVCCDAVVVQGSQETVVMPLCLIPQQSRA